MTANLCYFVFPSRRVRGQVDMGTHMSPSSVDEFYLAHVIFF